MPTRRYSACACLRSVSVSTSLDRRRSHSTASASACCYVDSARRSRWRAMAPGGSMWSAHCTSPRAAVGSERVGKTAMPTEIYLVKAGMTMTEGVVEEWYVPDGGRVEKGQLLYRLGTREKHHRGRAGASRHSNVPDGGRVEKGQLLYRLETEKINLDVDAEASGIVKHLVEVGVAKAPGDVVGDIFAPGGEVRGA